MRARPWLEGRTTETCFEVVASLSSDGKGSTTACCHLKGNTAGVAILLTCEYSLLADTRDGVGQDNSFVLELDSGRFLKMLSCR